MNHRLKETEMSDWIWNGLLGVKIACEFIVVMAVLGLIVTIAYACM